MMRPCCRKVFEYELEPVLRREGGLAGWFQKKGGQVDEGLACFYRTSRFTLKGIPNTHKSSGRCPGYF